MNSRTCTFLKAHKYQLKRKGGNGHVIIPMDNYVVPPEIFSQYEEVSYSKNSNLIKDSDHV